MPTFDRNRGGAVPPRIAARPRPDQWGTDELLTLQEAAALFWPRGPLTARSLRTAVEAGTLKVVMIARKTLTSPRAIEELCRCSQRIAVRETVRDRRPSDGDAARRRVSGSASERLIRKLDASGG